VFIVNRAITALIHALTVLSGAALLVVLLNQRGAIAIAVSGVGFGLCLAASIFLLVFPRRT
jgi:hypothetical protein